MSKIQHIIDAGYCEDWSAWEGVRELVSNAKDAEDMDRRRVMEIHHAKKAARLVIRTKNVMVDPATLLVLGKSDKRGRGVRGRFGEGFVVGCLALIRAGHAVTFRNHDLSWRCVFERADADHPLAGSELLTFYSRAVTQTPDFEVTIENITEDVWSAMRPLFLFMTPPPAEETVKVSQGSLILSPDRKGMVFARGVFVKRFDNLQCGYDLDDVPLDRDRQMIDEWHLHNKLSELWLHVVDREGLAQKAYELVKDGADETRHFRWRTDDKLVTAMRSRFVAEHGEEAIPVTTMNEARELETLGAKPVVVNDTLKELLAKTGLSAAGAKTALEGRVIARLLPGQLTDVEQAALRLVDALSAHYVVVEFHGPSACRLIDDDKIVAVDRRILAQPPAEVLQSVARVEAKRRGVDETTMLAQRLASALVKAREAREGYEACDECGNDIPEAEPHTVNRYHKDSCSLYPHDDAEAKPDQ